jgi:hypothetical protein
VDEKQERLQCLDINYNQRLTTNIAGDIPILLGPWIAVQAISEATADPTRFISRGKRF